MSEPITQGEYEARYAAHRKIEGHGVEGIRIHHPCPFCGAAGFAVCGIFDAVEALGKGATCGECGRSARTITHRGPNGSIHAHLVQTGGKAPAPWIPIARDTFTPETMDALLALPVVDDAGIPVLALDGKGGVQEATLMPPRKISTSGRVEPGYEDKGAPEPINPATGQHRGYWVLSPEETGRGFVRPLRRAYKHVGPPGPKHPTRELTPDELARYGTDPGYVRFETYPEGLISRGRFWTQEQLDRVEAGACGTTTTMSADIAATYARNPGFYGSTFCVHCRDHFPVGADGEFTWDGTTERVGT